MRRFEKERVSLFSLSLSLSLQPSSIDEQNEESLDHVILTVVLDRTLFDGSNESDNRGEVTLSTGVDG